MTLQLDHWALKCSYCGSDTYAGWAESLPVLLSKFRPEEEDVSFPLVRISRELYNALCSTEESAPELGDLVEEPSQHEAETGCSVTTETSLEELVDSVQEKVVLPRLGKHLLSEVRRLDLQGMWTIVGIEQNSVIEIQRDGAALWTVAASRDAITSALEAGMGPTVWSAS